MYRAALWIRDVVLATALAWIGVTLTSQTTVEKPRAETERRLVYGADEAGACDSTKVSLSAGGNCLVVVH